MAKKELQKIDQQKSEFFIFLIKFNDRFCDITGLTEYIRETETIKLSITTKLGRDSPFTQSFLLLQFSLEMWEFKTCIVNFLNLANLILECILCVI